MNIHSKEKIKDCEDGVKGEEDHAEDEDEEEDDAIDVGLMDNLRTAGGALLLLCLFLRNIHHNDH